MPNPIFDFEDATTEDAARQSMQHAINDGSVWHMQGSLGRSAMAMIEAGQCALGLKGVRDYWGSYIPNRNEVRPGTKGSVEYVEAHGYTVLD
jgi:hypothetical protein